MQRRTWHRWAYGEPWGNRMLGEEQSLDSCIVQQNEQKNPQKG